MANNGTKGHITNFFTINILTTQAKFPAANASANALTTTSHLYS